MSDINLIDKILKALNESYPNGRHLKMYFTELFGNDQSQHDKRRMVTDILMNEQLAEPAGGDKADTVFLKISPKGRKVMLDGGYQYYLNSKSTKTERQNEIDQLTFEKLKIDTASARRIYKTYWYTFAFAITGLLISLILLLLKLFE